MLRRSVGVLLIVLLAASSVTAATPEASFELGMRAFRAGDYASAVVDLQSAADAFGLAGAERMASYQTALVYLALAQFRLDREDDARATVNRLLEAERAYPAYATLPLDNDAVDFEALAAALAPGNTLPRNTQLVVGDALTPLPTVRPVTPPQETPVTTTPAAVEATTEVRVEEIQADTERRIAAIEAEATRRIAEIQADADRRIAAAQAAADARVAAAQAAANERVAAAEQQAQRDAYARIAALNRRADEQIASSTQTETPTLTTQPPVETRPAATTGTAHLTTLREADELVRRGEVDAAHEVYVRLANDGNVERNVLAESAVGLYRIGSYREAVDAFHRMNVFARGEEDLRYYFAVALYESGDYRGAQKELACALPFIEVTDDVARYRLKIEQAVAVTMAQNF